MPPLHQQKNPLSSSPSRMFDNFIFGDQTPRIRPRHPESTHESWTPYNATVGQVLENNELYYKTSPTLRRDAAMLSNHNGQQINQMGHPIGSSPANATLGSADAHFQSLLNAEFPFSTGTTPGDRLFRVSDFLQDEMAPMSGALYESPTKFYESLLGKENETPYSKRIEDTQLRLKTPLREVTNQRRSRSPAKKDTFTTPAAKVHQSSPSTIIIASSHANTVQRKAIKNEILQSPTPAKNSSSFNKQRLESPQVSVTSTAPTMGIFSDTKKKSAPETKKRGLTDMQSGMNRFQIVMADVAELAKPKKKRSEKGLSRAHTTVQAQPQNHSLHRPSQNQQHQQKKPIARSVSVPSYPEGFSFDSGSKDMTPEQFLGNLLKNRNLLDGDEDAGLDALFEVELDPQLLGEEQKFVDQ
ncbi:unnamed protein product [Kuraishia capsulata CBS 1993]|uniref:Uncharacterized protein n=1 Tax=Kuraishia capsulata CBS 1993 TaxID=1382522 RepID=W6MMQ5_9ASCO|nr:uncharacterized protein KUCA_T00003830001 [Kuraishia capsulata CBS 1993]CDK27851.1 unnamed protein product [Kuraishia capsulata CBS 1993]